MCRPCALLFIAAAAFAYDPPAGTAGPLTVRMQAPALGAYGAGGFAELSRPGVPLTLPVYLQNSSASEITGAVRVTVIDRWRVEPGAPVPFRVPPHGRVRREFTLSFAEGTHSAHYPVHAYAEFAHQGRQLTAHAVLIVQTRIPDLPQLQLPVQWEPVPVPAGSRLGLWRLPVRREMAELASQGAAAGLTGREVYDAAAIIRYDADGIAMTLGPRPPSLRDTVAAAAVEYPIALPRATPLRLEFAHSGDATFLVKVDGASVFEHAGTGTATVDVAKFSGSHVLIRLEARGKRAEARWEAPTVIAGIAPDAPPFPPREGGRVIGTAGGCEVRLWPGSRGLLDAPVGFRCGSQRLWFRGFRVRVTGDALEDARASTELVETRVEPADGRHRVRHRFRNWAGSFDVLAELWVERDALRSRFWLENTPSPKPWFQVTLEAVSAGPWSDPIRRFYGGPGNVIEKPQAFRLGFDGHSLATSFIGFDFSNGAALVQNSTAIPDAVEVDPASGIASLVTPHAQTLEFYPAETVWTAVKRLRDQDTRRPSRGAAKLAGRFTFDLWSGNYAESARALQKAVQYGLTNSVVVWHNWQRWGYDYRLPEVYPPNPQYGSMADFTELVNTCKRHGILFAPHDNYIDLYPDADGFSYGNVVFRQNGQPYRAWFNYGREAQSYRARPDRLKQYVEQNLRQIKAGFSPTAYFIDVWSSMAPYDYWTEEGTFVARDTTRTVWGEVFAWIRDTLGDDAPQISEAGHDKLIGWLDGADAQQLRVDPDGKSFTWRIRAADSERIPWIDVAWHDKFILHGAGYGGRYDSGLDPQTHGMYSDDYMATEVLSGRPAMVSHPFSRDVVRKYWLLNDAMQALALDRIETVTFAGDNLHRQHVRWTRGAEVWVNRGADDWTVNGHTLPQYGFYLQAPGGIEAGVERLGTHVAEWSRSPSAIYVNGRGNLVEFATASTAGAFRLRREGDAVVLTPIPDGGAFAATVHWNKLPWKMPPRPQGPAVTVRCEPGVFDYRLQ